MDSAGKWQNPVNLGDSINSPGDEMSPFIHPDNATLYFSSDYLLGMGGFDLFVSRKDSGNNWSKPENLGYPINTSRDEVGLIVNAQGNTAYYASGIHSDRGKDIYCFTLYEKARPHEVSYIKGRVFDEKTRERLRARFELYDLDNGTLVSRSFSDGRSGEFLLCIPTNKNYMLNVEHKGYLFYSDNFLLEGIYHLEKPFLKDVPLRPIMTGEKTILKNVFFESDSYELKPESRYELDKVLRFLKTNPELFVEISGHTDSIGTAQYNYILSENRAKSVVDYLTSRGISEVRLDYRGYGCDQPIDVNDTEEGRANNRRTELRIIGTKE
jgi:outer membrane protein OmpA-like peptidoglycan-associated protein